MKQLLCLLRGFHRTGKGELSYELATKKISVHCKTCQKVVKVIDNETQLNDEQWVWFKKIFEDEMVTPH